VRGEGRGGEKDGETRGREIVSSVKKREREEIESESESERARQTDREREREKERERESSGVLGAC